MSNLLILEELMNFDRFLKELLDQLGRVVMILLLPLRYLIYMR